MGFHHDGVLYPAPVTRFALTCLWLCLLTLLAPTAGRAAGLADVWEALADSRSKDALRLLDKLPADRAAQLARALAITHLQPVTDDNLRQAEAGFTAVAGGDDELAWQALYLRARLHQLHYAVPDPQRAAELYAELADRAPASRWGQLAVVKLALLHLYLLAEPAEPAARIARAEALLARVHAPGLQRDLHLQIGQAGIFHGQPLAGVIAHLLAADRIGGVPGTAREDLLLQIGELSLRDGQYAQARDYFGRYLQDYAVNPRCFTVRHRLAQLAELEAKGGAQ